MTTTETCAIEYGCKGVNGGPCLKAAHIDGQIKSLPNIVIAQISRSGFEAFLQRIADTALPICQKPNDLRQAIKRGREAAKKL